ncbi:MAG: glycosyltransferase family 2 protein [Gammaproteobacteria bacterium]
MTEKDESIAVVVLNWNGGADTVECIRSLAGLRYRNYKIILVDNGSTDESLEQVRQLNVAQLEVIENGANLGYAEGNNRGIHAALAAGSDYILLLNNDTIVDPDLCGCLIRAARENAAAGVFGARIYYMDRPDVIWFAGARWNPVQLRFDYPGQGLHESEFRQWCMRARRQGFECEMVADARVWHKVGASFSGEESALRTYFSARNRLLWTERNLPVTSHLRIVMQSLRRAWPRFVMVRANTSGLPRQILWAVADFLRTIRRRRTDPREIARRAGLRDYLLRRFGDCPTAIRALKGERDVGGKG